LECKIKKKNHNNKIQITKKGLKMQNKTLHYSLDKMETTKVLLGNQESKEKKIEILRTILKKKI
jgi:hypothetical protein